MNHFALSENTFGDIGGCSLLDCLHNVNEWELMHSKLSRGLKIKIKELARAKSVKITFDWYGSKESADDLENAFTMNLPLVVSSASTGSSLQLWPQSNLLSLSASSSLTPPWPNFFNNNSS